MGATSTDSMASVVTSLTNSFNSVPHAAVPSILDCVLSSTGLSPSSLFDSLLNAFSDFLKDIVKQDNGQSDLAQSSYISSFTTALCYLLKKSGTDPSALQSFILRGYLPVMKTIKANDHQLLNLIAEELSDAVTESNTWKVIEASLVPYSLRSVGISIGMHQNEDSAIYKWNEHSIIHGIAGMLNGSNVDKESMLPLNGSLPLAISCHILTSLLVASLRNCQTLESPPESVLLNGYSDFFCRNLLWDICAMTIRMLSQCPDHRSCATHLLLPFILRIFARHSSFQITVQGKIHVLSRDSFFKEIWKCCQALFCLGPPERGDAYCVLSLYISTFYHKEGCEDIAVCNEVEEFDIRTEQRFWDEIRRGLVAKEAFVRKQSLNMLKLSLSKPDERHCNTGIFENNLVEESSTSLGLTRRGKWAEEEAKSLGVGKTCSVTDTHSNGQQMWDAFVLLYEMLEEYGTHLVEAAWDHQISMLLSFPCRQHSSLDVISGVNQSQMETLEGMFSWLAVLWERGLCHENPQVRCLIMQSFLSINWKDYGTCEKLVHEIFIIGPFIQGLNDPVHHKEFGVKGVYSSETIEGATTFVSQYCKHMHWRVRISLMGRLASLVREESFGRAGLMALSACIASAAYGVQCCEVCSSNVDQQESTVGNLSRNSKADLLDMLRLVTESCRQHFNLNYRHRVCKNVLEAASSVICASDVPLETLMHFISTVPRESTDYGGSLRANVQKWLSKCNERLQSSDSLCTMHVMHSLCDYPGRFVEYNHSLDASVTYDDGDIEAWELEGQRWARVFLLVITEGHCLEFICEFLRNHGINIREQHNQLKWLPLKFLILNLALVQELQIMKMKFIDCEIKVRSNQESHMLGTSDLLLSTHISVIFENLTDAFLFISEELVLFANLTCSKFWCCSAVDSHLPSSVRGKLGGPSQRRLPSSVTTSVLEAILSMKTVASLSTWCAQFRSDYSLDFTFNCLWRFSQKVILSPTDDLDSETGAEIRLAAYEALVHVLKSVASSMTPVMFGLVMAGDKSLLSKEEGRHWLDILLLSFLRNINGLIALGTLARSRRAVLMNWKWLCLNSLLSVLHCVIENEVQFGCNTTLISTASMKFIYSDLVGSLENASENSVLPMLRSVRLIFGLFASGRLGLTVLSSGGINIEMLWELVNSSWILHVSCNKRKIAHIAALLSSVLHCSIFHDDRMHETAENMQGPYKWFIEKILEEGTKSPRTIRLAALHLTGLWLLYPKTVRYYIKELKLLSLFGSVAFDEDFEAELAENQDASTEVSLLAKGSETELTEEFMNTELYARVCVAVLFHQLANLVDKLGSVNETEDCHAALHAGKAFLLELLDSAVNDTDLAKELYKKYSGDIS